MMVTSFKVRSCLLVPEASDLLIRTDKPRQSTEKDRQSPADLKEQKQRSQRSTPCLLLSLMITTVAHQTCSSPLPLAGL